MLNGLLVFVGTGLGGLARYALSAAVAGSVASRAAWGTLAANILGCLLAGIVGAWLAGSFPMRDALRSAIMVGLLGGFTTFSAFAREATTLSDSGRGWLALAYIVGTNITCLAAAWGGAILYRRLIGG
jgi:fluoride exporter